MITIADAWVQEGFEKGVLEGRQEILRDMARRLLKLHNIVIVSEITDLTLEEVQTLAQAESSQANPSPEASEHEPPGEA